MLAIVSLLLLAGIGPRPDATPCFAGDRAATQRIFEGLASARPSDGCILGDVHGDPARIEIRWSKGGRPQEPIVATPSARVSGSRWSLSATVPTSTLGACPEGVVATVKVLRDEGLTLEEVSCGGEDRPVDDSIAGRASALVAGHEGMRVSSASSCGVVLVLEGEPGEAVPSRPAPPEQAKASPQVLGVLRLLPPGAGARIRSKSFEVEVEARTPSPRVLEALAAATRDAVARDDGTLFSDAFTMGETPKPPPQASEHRCPERDPSPAPIGAAAALAALVAAAIGLARKAKVSAAFGVRLPHALPAAIQLSIFAYWALYWPKVATHGRAVLLQVLLAYALDAAFSFARFRSWRVGLSVLPIVLSANLFAWLGNGASILFLVVAVGSKALVRRGDKHVLNPAAAGLTAAGIAALLAPSSFGYGGVFHTTNVPPNMTELVLLLALAPQIRFPIVLVSVGAALGAVLPGLDTVLISAPLVVLAFALLATDPATIPGTPAGRLVFGLLVGAGTGLASLALTKAGQPDDFAKVFAIPLANALVPWLDRMGKRVPMRLLDPRYNGLHVAAWAAIVGWTLVRNKPSAFEGALHYTWGTPLVVRGDDDVPRCAQNPTFCRPFTFLGEARGWASRARSAER